MLESKIHNTAIFMFEKTIQINYYSLFLNLVTFIMKLIDY